MRSQHAACKRIDILGSCSGESLLAFLDKLLNSIEHILVNDTGMCSFGIEAIFLSAVDMLVKWDRCFTVSFLIETIADIPFIFQHIGYSVRMPALLAGLGSIKGFDLHLTLRALEKVNCHICVIKTDLFSNARKVGCVITTVPFEGRCEHFHLFYFFMRIVFHYADGKDFLQESIESDNKIPSHLI